MKKISILLVAIMALSIGTVSANDKQPKKDKETQWLTTQIYEMLADNAIPDDIRGAKAQIRIAMADDGVFRILSVDSNNAKLKNFLKDGIDLQNLDRGKKNVVYVIPVEIAE